MSKPKKIELSLREIEDLKLRIDLDPLSAADKEILKKIVTDYKLLVSLLGKKTASIMKLRKMVFGAKTESLKNILEAAGKEAAAAEKQKTKNSKKKGMAATASRPLPVPRRLKSRTRSLKTAILARNAPRGECTKC